MEKKSKKPFGYVVMLDRALSGWGKAPGRSIYALEVSSEAQAYIVIGNAMRRSEMRYVRFAKGLPRLRAGDHLSVSNRSEASRWYQEGGF